MIKLLKKIFIIAICIFCLFFSILILSSDLITSLIEDQINKQIPGSINVKSYSFSIFNGILILKNCDVFDSYHNKLAGFSSLDIDIDYKEILKGEFYIKELVFNEPWTTLSKTKDGDFNITSLLPIFEIFLKNNTPQEFEINSQKPQKSIVKSIKINNGLTFYEQKDKQIKISIENIDIFTNDNNLSALGNIIINYKDKLENKIGNFKINASFENDDVMIDYLFEALTAQSTYTVYNNTLSFLKKISYDLDMDLDLKVKNIKDILDIKTDISGDISLNLTSCGNANNPDTHLDILLKNGKFQKLLINKAYFNINIIDRILNLETLNIAAGSGNLGISGTIDMRKTFEKGFLEKPEESNLISYVLKLREKNFLNEYVINNYLNCEHNLSMLIKGNGIYPEDIDADFLLNFIGNNIYNNENKRIDIIAESKGNIKNQQIHINDLYVKSGDNCLNASGDYNIKKNEIDAAIDIKDFDLDENIAPLISKSISGSLSLNTTISGKITKPIVKMKFNSKDIAFNNITTGSINILADIDDKQSLNIIKASINSKSSNAKMTCEISNFWDVISNNEKIIPQHLSFFADNIKIEDFYSIYKANASIDIKLDSDKSIKPVGYANIVAKDISAGFYNFQAFRLTSQLKENLINVESLKIIFSGSEKIEAEGWLSLDKSFEFKVISNGISTNRLLDQKKYYIPYDAVKLSFDGKGLLNNPQINGAIGFSNYNQIKKFKNFSIKCNLKDNLLNIKANPCFFIDSSYDIKKDNISLSIIFNKTDLSKYFTLFGYSDFGGTLNGSIKAVINPKTYDHNVSVDISNFDIKYNDNQVIYGQNISGYINDNNFLAKNIQLILPGNGSLNAFINGKYNNFYNLDLKGKVPTSYLLFFTEKITELSGNIILDLNVNNKNSFHEINGDISLSNIGFQIPEILNRIQSFNGKLKIKSNKLIIKDTKGQLGNGKFEFNGEADFSGLKTLRPSNMNLTFNANNLPVYISDTLDLILNSQLEISLNKKSMIKGDIIVLEGIFYKDINLNMALLEKVSRKKRTEDIKNGYLNNLFNDVNFDISIKSRSLFNVENNYAKLKINPDLKLIGNISNPVISGRAEVDSGEIIFQKNSFVLSKGVIDFINPYKIEPVFDFKGESTIRQWDIILEITGTPEDIKFNIQSNPSLEHADIISLLVLGKTTREFVEKEKGNTQTTSQMLTELLGSVIENDIKKTTGLDVFKIEASEKDVSEDNTNESESIKVTIGKDLSKRLSLKYAMESDSGEIIQQTRADYKLLENLILRGFQDTKGSYGGELHFRMEFR